MQNPFSARQRARLRAFFGKPANVILVVFAVLLCMLTLYPLMRQEFTNGDEIHSVIFRVTVSEISRH